MIYLFYSISSTIYNTFLVDEKDWPQHDRFMDYKELVDRLKSNDPFKRIQLKESWKPMEVELHRKTKKCKIADITKINASYTPVFSEKAMKVLEEFLSENGEFLELKCIDDGKTYYAYNVLTYVDIGNEEKSLVVDNKMRWYFKKDVDFDKFSIFKILSKNAYGNIYLSQKFVEKVHKYKLTGLEPYTLQFYEESVTNKEQLEYFRNHCFGEYKGS